MNIKILITAGLFTLATACSPESSNNEHDNGQEHSHGDDGDHQHPEDEDHHHDQEEFTIEGDSLDHGHDHDNGDHEHDNAPGHF